MPDLLRVFTSLLLLASAVSLRVNAQVVIPTKSLDTLSEVTIAAFGSNKKLRELPAAAAFVGKKEFSRSNNTSMLSGLNSVAGVRMEERSPGSYRLAIRGSALRSPFGVRNVKVYYNGIPFTQPGGQSYLGQLGFYNIESATVLKGPAGSAYGAGTGGALLIQSIPDSFHSGARVAYTYGTYQMHNALAELRTGKEKVQSTIRYQHLQNEGYRRQSEIQRDIVSSDVRVKLGASTILATHVFATILRYGTPGGLTKQEYDANARAARPASGNSPSAEDAQAALHQKAVFAGLVLRHQFKPSFSNETSLYGAYTSQRNPAIRNYGEDLEPSLGLRSVFNYQHPLFNKTTVRYTAGLEVQYADALVKVFTNDLGAKGALQSSQRQKSTTSFGFAQIGFENDRWQVQAGSSVNFARISIQKEDTLKAENGVIKKNYNGILAPRISALYKWSSLASWYAIVSKGFSPPTLAELSPSGSSINSTLQAESGWNYEVGLRGRLPQNRLEYELNLFYFSLDKAIVQRRDAGGGDFYTNAGGTKQLGAEAALKWSAINNPKFKLHMWSAYTYYYFRYKSFQQVDKNYTGNHLPGAAPYTLTTGTDVDLSSSWRITATAFYSSKMYLNDANTNMGDAYLLMGFRASWAPKTIRKLTATFYATAENVLNTAYSLGYDINAFGGRYYNAAAGRNYSVGVVLAL